MVVAAGLCWGTAAVAPVLGGSADHPLANAGVRCAIGFLALLVISRPRSLVPDRREVLAGLAVAAFSVCYFGAVARTGVVATVTLTSGTAPVFAALGGTVFFGRRPTAVWWAATALTVAGCVLVTTGGGGGFRVDPFGALLAVGAGLSYATYAAAASRSAQIGVAASLREQVGSTCRVLGVGGVVLLPVSLPALGFLADVSALLGALWLGVVGTGVAYALFRIGARTVPVATATSLSMVDAATGAVLGVLVVGEAIARATVVGVLAVLLGATALQLALTRVGTDRTTRPDAATPIVER